MKSLKTTLLCALVVAAFAPALYAGVPWRTNYQGRLKTNNLPANGSITMQFKLWNSLAGSNWGTDGIWDSGAVSVVVSSGLFNYVFTGGTPDFSVVDWANKTPYIEVTVGATALTPREQLSAAPYALYAASAAYSANGVWQSGFLYSPLGWDNVVKLPSGWDNQYAVAIGTGTVYGKLTISTYTDHIGLHIQGADANTALWGIKAEKNAAGSSRFQIYASNDAWSSWWEGMSIYRNATGITSVNFMNGAVGIGVLTPKAELDISGSLRLTNKLILVGTDVCKDTGTFAGWTSIMGGPDIDGGAYLQLGGSMMKTQITSIADGGAQLLITSHTAVFQVRTRQDLPGEATQTPPMLLVRGDGKIGINTWDAYDSLDLSTGAIRFYDYNVPYSTYTTIFGNACGLNLYTSRLGQSNGGFLRIGEIWAGMGLYSGDGIGGGYNLGLAAPAGKLLALGPNGGNPFTNDGVIISTGAGGGCLGPTLGIGIADPKANLYVVGTSTITGNAVFDSNVLIKGTLTTLGAGAITGSGYRGGVAVFTGGTTISSSTIVDNGYTVGINQLNPSANYRLDVAGDVALYNARLTGTGDMFQTVNTNNLSLSGGIDYQSGAFLQLGGDLSTTTDVNYGGAQITLSTPMAHAGDPLKMPMFRVRSRNPWQDLLVVRADGRIGLLAVDPQAQLHISSTSANPTQWSILFSTANNSTGYAWGVKGDGSMVMKQNNGINWTNSAGAATTRLWMDVNSHLATSSMIFKRGDTDGGALYLWGGSDNMSSAIELHGKSDAQPGHMRLILPDGMTSQGMDIALHTQATDGYASLFYVSTGGVMFFGDTASKQFMWKDTVYGAIDFSSNVFVNGKVIPGSFATASAPLPQAGAIFYDTTKKRLQLYDGSNAWVDISTGVAATSALGGSGASSYVAMFTGGTSISTASITDNGSGTVTIMDRTGTGGKLAISGAHQLLGTDDVGTMRLLGGLDNTTCTSIELNGPNVADLNNRGAIKLITGKNTGAKEGVYFLRAGDWTKYMEFTTTGSIVLNEASNTNDASPALVGALNDDFAWGGRYLNHYAFGFNSYNDGTNSGRNAYISGYSGVNIFAGGINGFRVVQGGNLQFGWDNANAVSTYTYASGNLNLAGKLYPDRQLKRYIGDNPSQYAIYVSTHLYPQGSVILNEATNVQNASPGLIGSVNDDMAYGGRRINNYGFGFHNFMNGAGGNGTNAYVSGYMGINMFTATLNRLRIDSAGNIGLGYDSVNNSTYTYGTGDLNLGGDLTVRGSDIRNAIGIAQIKMGTGTGANSYLALQGDNREPNSYNGGWLKLYGADNSDNYAGVDLVMSTAANSALPTKNRIRIITTYNSGSNWDQRAAFFADGGMVLGTGWNETSPGDGVMYMTGGRRISSISNDSSISITGGTAWDQGAMLQLGGSSAGGDVANGGAQIFITNNASAQFRVRTLSTWYDVITAKSNGDVLLGVNPSTTTVQGQFKQPQIPVGVGTAVNVDANGLYVKNTSSKRYKDNIKSLKTDFTKILLLEPKAFNYKGSGAPDIGYIAEDVESIGLRDLVIYDNKGQPDALKYDRFTVYTIEVIKDQQKKIEDLEERIKKLEKKIK